MPYTIDEAFTDSERQVIAAAINDIEDNSCVRWSPRVNNENPFVEMKRENNGCFSYIGANMDGVLNLGNGCLVSHIHASYMVDFQRKNGSWGAIISPK